MNIYSLAGLRLNAPLVAGKSESFEGQTATSLVANKKNVSFIFYGL